MKRFLLGSIFAITLASSYGVSFASYQPYVQPSTYTYGTNTQPYQGAEHFPSYGFQPQYYPHLYGIPVNYHPFTNPVGPTVVSQRGVTSLAPGNLSQSQTPTQQIREQECQTDLEPPIPPFVAISETSTAPQDEPIPTTFYDPHYADELCEARVLPGCWALNQDSWDIEIILQKLESLRKEKAIEYFMAIKLIRGRETEESKELARKEAESDPRINTLLTNATPRTDDKEIKKLELIPKLYKAFSALPSRFSAFKQALQEYDKYNTLSLSKIQRATDSFASKPKTKPAKPKPKGKGQTQAAGSAEAETEADTEAEPIDPEIEALQEERRKDVDKLQKIAKLHELNISAQEILKFVRKDVAGADMAQNTFQELEDFVRSIRGEEFLKSNIRQGLTQFVDVVPLIMIVRHEDLRLDGNNSYQDLIDQKMAYVRLLPDKGAEALSRYIKPLWCKGLDTNSGEELKPYYAVLEMYTSNEALLEEPQKLVAEKNPEKIRNYIKKMLSEAAFLSPGIQAHWTIINSQDAFIQYYFPPNEDEELRERIQQYT